MTVVHVVSPHRRVLDHCKVLLAEGQLNAATAVNPARTAKTVVEQVSETTLFLLLAEAQCMKIWHLMRSGAVRCLSPADVLA